MSAIHGIKAGGPDVDIASLDQASRLRAIVSETAHKSSSPVTNQARPAIRLAEPTARVVTIASGKGGVGKTNAAVNLCIALAQSGARTSLVDADLGLANADVLCGLTPTRRLERLMDQRQEEQWGDDPDHQAEALAGMASIAVDAPGGFRLVPGAMGVAEMADLGPQGHRALVNGLAEIESESDVVIVDTGAGLSGGVTSFFDAADLGVIVTTPEPTAIADAYALIKCVRLMTPGDSCDTVSRAGSVPLALLINQVTGVQEAKRVHARISAVTAKFLGCRIPMLGWIRQDDAVGAAVRRRRPFLLHSPKSMASKDMRVVATSLSRILSITSPPRAVHSRRGDLGRLFRMVRS